MITKIVTPSICCLTLVLGVAAADPPDVESTAAESHGRIDLADTDATVTAYRRNGRIARLYGQAFSHGATPEVSADAFIAANDGALDLSAADLVPAELFSQPLVYDSATDSYKFTAVYYEQVRGGLPVFRSRLVLLVRNEAGFPLVLANPYTTRDLGAFQVQPDFGPDRIPDAVAQRYGGQTQIMSRDRVIFAGEGDVSVEPRVAEAVLVAPDDVDRWLLVIDTATGAVLYEEHRVFFADIEGTVGGNATLGEGAEHCEEEGPVFLPYLTVAGGGAEATTDIDGNYVLTGVDGSVTVEADLSRGAHFQIENFLGPLSLESGTGTPPGPVDLFFNADNTDEQIRAQVNGYFYANLVRDFALRYNPSYPNLDPGDGFPVVVNRTDGFCPGNAWYEPGAATINFCLSEKQYPNTAWSSIVYHEFGHHLVEAGGSGQEQYGEGMSDTISTLILDSADVGIGFFGSCAEPLRDADNLLQYPCFGEIHFCGQLIAGCVWETRNRLKMTEPDAYRDILSSLVINSIPLHTGGGISPDITIDFLTLDDDNGDILDGTPHFVEIALGFGDHGMEPPGEFQLLDVTFPGGLPSSVHPNGTTTMAIAVADAITTPDASSVLLHADSGAGFETVNAVETSPGVFEATFPTSACGSTVEYYFSLQTIEGAPFVWPIQAPARVYTTYSASSLDAVFVDDFETDAGWTVSSISLQGGAWERGVPVGNGERGDPTMDADGSGACFLTENDAGNSDVDGGPTRLMSPQLDLSGYTDPVVEYAWWFSNDDEDIDRLDVHVRRLASGTWTQVDSIAHEGSVWVRGSFRVTEFVSLSDTFQLRFTTADNPNNSVTEAAIDAVGVYDLVCGETCPADFDETGEIGFTDLLSVLSSWGTCAGCQEDLDGSGDVGFTDLLAVLASWGPCDG